MKDLHGPENLICLRRYFLFWGTIKFTAVEDKQTAFHAF